MVYFDRKGDNMENNLVRFEDENGKTFEMIILKEFDYKKKKYAVLMSGDCSCGDDCNCHDDKECNCDDECECGCHGSKKEVFLLEITKDKDNNEMFKQIEDEKLFDEVVKEADKILYEE